MESVLVDTEQYQSNWNKNLILIDCSGGSGSSLVEVRFLKSVGGMSCKGDSRFGNTGRHVADFSFEDR